ncbi:glutathione S-transferase theta-1-like [Actinia tenebrosa]|uniref:Glutathione S-transferase theta-1-like n=1 Tax=Actinia tenebrosa TaxID=6105 RepID=A0A6P8IT33_ACTTE|nr:glutathione S-transferase theta-1-like [Actinia tenebrosa]
MAPPLTFYLRKDCVECRVVWLYMIRNKITFTMVDIDDARPVGFAGMSPLGSVPMIIDDKNTITGCLAIVMYLAEKYTGFSGFGQTPEVRARIESIICWAATALTRDVAHNYVYPSLQRQEDSLPGESNISLISFGKSEVMFHLNTLENQYLSKSPFLSCDRETFADSWVTVVLSLLEFASFDFSPWPKVKAWMNNVKANCDYVNVSHTHEEKARQFCYGFNKSIGDVRSV